MDVTELDSINKIRAMHESLLDSYVGISTNELVSKIADFKEYCRKALDFSTQNGWQDLTLYAQDRIGYWAVREQSLTGSTDYVVPPTPNPDVSRAIPAHDAPTVEDDECGRSDPTSQKYHCHLPRLQATSATQHLDSHEERSESDAEHEQKDEELQWPNALEDEKRHVIASLLR